MNKIVSGIVEYSPRVLKNGKTLSAMATNGKTSTFVYGADNKLALLRDKIIERSKDGENTVITVIKKHFREGSNGLIEKVTTTRVYDALKTLVKETSEKIFY